MKISVCTPSIRPEGLKVLQKCLQEQTWQDFEWLVEIGLPEKGHDINAAYNRMIRRAKGEIFVSIQDYTVIPPDFLEQIVANYQDDTFTTIPLGKVKSLTDFSFDDTSAVIWDWRKERTEGIQNHEWEIDVAFCPMQGLRDIGGFDEELDRYWSFDNVSVGYRAARIGYKFALLSTVFAVAYDHDADIPHPFRSKWNPPFWALRKAVYDLEHNLGYL